MQTLLMPFFPRILPASFLRPVLRMCLLRRLHTNTTMRAFRVVEADNTLKLNFVLFH